MRINSFGAHFDEVFASIFGHLPKPRLAKCGQGWVCWSPSVVVIGAPSPALAYAEWQRGWAQAETLKRPNHHTTQDSAA